MNKEKLKLQKKYNSLSLVDRNAYEAIIERNTYRSFWIRLPYTFVKLITLMGVFFISTALLAGVPISIFRESYLQILALMIQLVFIFMIVGIVWDIIETYRLNKLKKKLLS